MLFLSYLVESFAVDSNCGRLGYECVFVNAFYDVEYFVGLVFAAHYCDDFYGLFGVPALCVDDGYAAVEVGLYCFGNGFVFFCEYEELDGLAYAVNHHVYC